MAQARTFSFCGRCVCSPSEHGLQKGLFRLAIGAKMPCNRASFTWQNRPYCKAKQTVLKSGFALTLRLDLTDGCLFKQTRGSAFSLHTMLLQTFSYAVGLKKSESTLCEASTRQLILQTSQHSFTSIRYLFEYGKKRISFTFPSLATMSFGILLP